MKTLREILAGQKVLQLWGDDAIRIKALTMDSRQVENGTVFFAIRGSAVDGHNFISNAISAGATAIVAEDDAPNPAPDITWVKVEDSSRSLGMAASAFFDNPSSSLKLVGITGTNGKTSIATSLYQLYSKFGYAVGLLSTVENRIGNTVIPATHTTPDPISLNRLLAQMVEAGCEYAFMECSSHAIEQNRIAGLDFVGAVFTNLTHDHLDYHKTFDNYLKAKKKLFDELPVGAFALVNRDDRNGKVMVQNCKASIYTYALKHPADFKTRVLEADLNGSLLEINGVQAWVLQAGEFNASNLTAVYGTAFLLEAAPKELIEGISTLRGAPGRFEIVNPGEKPLALVDYAHTPDALENLLETVNKIRSRNEQLLVVVGCGGNRDASKRPVMGAVAAKLADRVIFTSDNPRDEEPDAIISQMQKGVPAEYSRKTLAITDRKQAIRAALQMAQAYDIVVVAGKGHENYQEIKGVKYDFDDKAIIREQLNQLRES